MTRAVSENPTTTAPRTNSASTISSASMPTSIVSATTSVWRSRPPRPRPPVRLAVTGRTPALPLGPSRAPACSEQVVGTDHGHALGYRWFGEPGRKARLELLELGDGRQRVLDPIRNLQQDHERVLFGEPARGIPDPVRVCLLDRGEHRGHRGLNLGDAFGLYLGT